ncbi:hypothetical protein EBB07_26085 [Paenibacillaceae bacterium]|nr:hypothetical protein EBB07_26085 [Paenibacillaceae bacterium]
MVAQITIEEAIAVMGRKTGQGSASLYKALKKCKIDYMSWRAVHSLDTLPPLCILLVRFYDYNHSVLFYDGVYYDPEFGVMNTYTPDGEITHYMELFIDDIYACREIKLNIPDDFMQAFAQDQEAYDIFNQLPYPAKAKCINGISHFKNPLIRKNTIVKLLASLKQTDT